MPGQIAFATVFYFGQVFCRLINKGLLKWFLLIMLFVDASVICESLFRDRKADFSLFWNIFSYELVSYRNQSIDLRRKLVDCFLSDTWSAEISPAFWMGSFSLGVWFLQIFGWVAVNLRKLGIFIFILFIYFIYLFIYFRRGFSRRGVGCGFWILRGVISKHSIILFFFVVFKLALSRWNLLKVDIK